MPSRSSGRAPVRVSHTLLAAPAIALCVLAACTALPARAQTRPLNPQISVIGDTRAAWSEAEDDARIEFHELEISLVGPVNPYASAEVFVGVHGSEGLEVEEAKLILDRYLPAGLGLTVGRALQDFGQLNAVHLHAYPWVDRPLMHRELFGDDGVLDDGVRLDWLAPLEAVTLRATAGAVRGDLFTGGHAHAATDSPDSAAEQAAPEIGLTGRVELFAEPADSFSFLVGGSILRGEHDPAENAKATWLDADLKLRFDLGPYRALVVNAETVFGSLDGTDESPASDPNGFFAAADLRASKRWNVGGFAEASTQRDDDARTSRYGGFLGLSLMEETTVFRVVTALTDPEEGDSSTDVTFQAIFGLGPHRPHRY